MKVNPKEAPEGYIAKKAPRNKFCCHVCEGRPECCLHNSLLCTCDERKDGCEVYFVKKSKPVCDDIDAKYLLTVRGSPAVVKRLRKIAKRLNGGKPCTL